MMIKLKKFSIFLLLILVFCCRDSYSEPRYHLCGPDEDGCFIGQEQYCACIPYDEINFSKPYCLDFNNMKCEPLLAVPDCPKNAIYKDQGRCLATIYQSEPEPPCQTVTQTFCYQNHAWVCDNVNGDVHSCRPT